MSPLAGCVSLIGKMRLVRNEHLGLFEKWFYLLCVALVVLGFFLIITGSLFISQSLWSNGQFGLDKIKGAAAALIVSYCILTWIFGCAGIAITMNRKCHVGCIGIYGTLLFFIIAIPLMAEGSALLALENIDEENFRENCKMSLENPRDFDDVHNRLVVQFYEFAHRFDLLSEAVLDKYMCSKECPCLEYEMNYQNSKTVYEALNHTQLRNRTFNANDKSSKLMVYSKDEKTAFRSFT